MWNFTLGIKWTKIIKIKSIKSCSMIDDNNKERYNAVILPERDARPERDYEIEELTTEEYGNSRTK